VSKLSVSELLRKLLPGNLDAKDWAIRGSVALVFAIFGMEKLGGSSEWVSLFARLGLGQWFRTFTGILQVTGGALLLIPGAARFGATLLACTMAGAIFVHLFVLGTGAFAALIPAILLVVAIAAGWKGRGESKSIDGILTIR
jgi:uncharacterized membrane protein YphA (DoxX/SURF4 family)